MHLSLNPYGERTLACMHRSWWLAHSATMAGLVVVVALVVFLLECRQTDTDTKNFGDRFDGYEELSVS